MPQPHHGVRLERVGRKHAAAMYRWMLDPFVRSRVGLRTVPTLARTRAWVDRARSNRSTHAFAILYRNTHVGNVVLDRVDTTSSSARLSIYIGEPTMRGRGIGERALRMALGKAFTLLRLNKVWLIVQVDNRPAIRAYRKVGFVREGRLREESVSIDGRRADVFYMGILRSEFRQPS